MVERLLQETCRSVGIVNPIIFSSISYDDALVKYGSDKPDLRIPMTLHALPLSLSRSEAIEKIQILQFPEMAKTLSNSKLKQILKSMDSTTVQSISVLRVVL